MKSNYKLLFIIVLFSLIGISAVNAQTEGDYKSVQSGNWSTLTTWLRWDSYSVSWVTPTAAQGYPGQFYNVEGTVTILSEHAVTLDVNLPFDPVSSPYISTLVINGEMNFDSNKALNALEVDLYGGRIVWPHTAILALSANSIMFMDDSGGLVALPCNATQRLNLGIQGYAACEGYGKPQDIEHNSFLFDEVNSMNGSFYPIITSDAPVCLGGVINLFGTNSKEDDNKVTYLWSIKDASNNTVTITNPALKNISVSLPVGTYKVTLTVTYEYKQNKYYSNSKTIFVEVLNCDNWVGSADNIVSGSNRGTDWAIGSNWKSGFVPVEKANIGFDPNAVNHLQLDADHEINNLVNKTTKNLIIPPAKTLTANGALNIGSNPDKIQIQAAANTVNGSLILTDSILYYNSHSYKNKPVYATVQMWTKATRVDPPVSWYDDVTKQWYTNYYRWQYFGIPVQFINASPVFDGSWVYEYDETRNPDVYYGKWRPLTNSDMLAAFKGYEITQNEPKLITYQGLLVTGNQLLTLKKTTTGGTTNLYYGAGNNIFGNSFTAAIDVSKIVFGSGVQHTVYLYNTGSLADWGLNGQTMPTSGGSGLEGSYYAIPQHTSFVLGEEIPPMQGFMLITETDSAMVTIPYKHIVKPTTIQRAKRAEKTEKFSYMSVDVTGLSGHDRVWLFSQPGTSRGFDNGWDGPKIIASAGLNLYADEETGDYQVNTTDDLNGRVLALRAGVGTEYTLIINKRNLLGYETLYLTDLVTGIETDLSTADSISYSFTAANTESFDKRFMLSRISKVFTGNEDVDKATVKIYGVEKTIRIQNSGNEIGTVQLFDVTGKQIYSGIYQANTTTEIKTGLQPGVYLVNVKSAGISQHKTVLIHP